MPPKEIPTQPAVERPAMLRETKMLVAVAMNNKGVHWPTVANIMRLNNGVRAQSLFEQYVAALGDPNKGELSDIERRDRADLEGMIETRQKEIAALQEELEIQQEDERLEEEIVDKRTRLEKELEAIEHEYETTRETATARVKERRRKREAGEEEDDVKIKKHKL